ncbi:MAG: hypothetical protein JRJ00_17640 [Deltaproteobacteria bacterium]|nr:hypothetical protein [Deltaproteobacteria bacterium]
MKRIITLFLSLLLLIPLYSQEDELDVALADGDFFFLDEDYQEAIFYYLKLAGTDRMNENLNYKIGLCYLHIPGEEHSAISFLEKAIENTTDKYKARSSAETKAPIHSYFYLARAYHINNELDKALDMYNQFKGLPEFEGNYNVSMVDDEISACEKAKIIQDIPISIKVENNTTKTTLYLCRNWHSTTGFLPQERSGEIGLNLKILLHKLNRMETSYLPVYLKMDKNFTWLKGMGITGISM